MKMIRKLCSRRGESLTELLFSVLVMALATALLAAAIGSAAGVNAKAMEQAKTLNEQLQAVESAGGTATDKVYTVTVSDGSNDSTADFNVKLYGTVDGLYGYFPEEVP